MLKEWMAFISLSRGAKGSDLEAGTRFVTLALFERCLLLWYVLVLPNSSTHVATLHLGPMRSLWAYVEGMYGLHLTFMGGKVLRFGGLDQVCGSTLALFERCLLLWYMSWCFPILLG